MAQRKTKYAAVTANLPKLPMVEPERRDIVNAVKDEILATKKIEDDLILPEGPTYTDLRPSARSHEDELIEKMAVMQACVRRVIELEKHRTRGRRYASEFGMAYIEVRAVKEKLQEWLASVQLLLDAYLELMVDQMEVESVDAMRTEMGSISTSEEPYGVVKDKEAFRQWCVKNGYEGKLQLWPATMNTVVKERVLAGDPAPDGVEVFAVTKVRLNQ